jgi:hypothetical protein
VEVPQLMLSVLVGEFAADSPWSFDPGDADNDLGIGRLLS